jgi:two-component system sensor histidine kinase PhoQ
VNFSIHSRIIASAFIILILFLGLTGLVLDEAFQNNARNAQRENLRTQIYTLLATAELNDNNQLVLPDEITEPRLNIVDSTLHARVVKPEGGLVWQSKSMLGTRIDFPAKIKIGEFIFSQAGNAQLSYTLLSFATLWVTDQGEQHYIFQVAENNKTLHKQIAVFRKNLWGWLAGVAVLLLLVQAIILRWGLTPLRHVAEDLLKIEQGKAQHLSGDYPKELAPLTGNLNQLLESSRQQLSRYRDALGNMAHSLKTPIAVLRGIIDSSSIEQKDTASGQLDSINNIVDYQLQRAATAGRQSSNALNDIKPIIEKIIQSLDKVYHDKQVAHNITIPDSLQVKVDEGDLYELLGNLLDNAFKWCSKEIHFTASRVDSQTRLIIEDDGPGIDKDERDRILLRGQRADQNTPGHGLGMAMVSDMLLLYQGSLEITDSQLGGTKIIIEL